MNDGQKHKEDLEAAKGWLAIAKENNNKIAIQILEKFFPELRESDDERIRKELIKIFSNREKYLIDQSFGDITVSEVLAWLEKQAEQKLQCKSALEAWKEMRFEVYQQASGNRHEPNYSDDSTKMFSLTDIDEIFEKIAEKQGEQSCYHNDGLYYAIDILEKTLGKVEGYQSDDGIIEHQTAIETVNALYHKKPAKWSEEDDKMLGFILVSLEAQAKQFPQSTKCIREQQDWLKSLKPQNHWKPSER